MLIRLLSPLNEPLHEILVLIVSASSPGSYKTAHSDSAVSSKLSLDVDEGSVQNSDI